MLVQLACIRLTNLLNLLSRPPWSDWQVHAFSAELQQNVHATLIRPVASNKQLMLSRGDWVPRISTCLGRC